MHGKTDSEVCIRRAKTEIPKHVVRFIGDDQLMRIGVGEVVQNTRKDPSRGASGSKLSHND